MNKLRLVEVVWCSSFNYEIELIPLSFFLNPCILLDDKFPLSSIIGDLYLLCGFLENCIQGDSDVNSYIDRNDSKE